MKKIYPTFVFSLFLFSSLSSVFANDDEDSFYGIETIAIPDDLVLEIGGMAFDADGNLAVCTRRGDVYIIEKPYSSSPTFIKYASGLHEPLGMAYRNGDFYLAQRGELTRLRDTDQDGKADLYENIYTWELVGNYHEYSYGPVFLPNGDMLVTLNLGWVGRGASLSKWRGWMVKITAGGELKPLASGMRSPAGFGLNKNGDIFYAENQGDWVGSGRISHVEEGDFLGHPEGLKWSQEADSPLSLKMEDVNDEEGLSFYEQAQKRAEFKLPSVWFPHAVMGISTADILLIPEGFGPFEGQLLVGDQGQSKIMRVFQEKVNGEYQGACFPFREGFASGILRLTWGPDKSLYVGMTNRGWASTGVQSFGLERLVWKNKNPFEMKEIRVQADGFEISFTEAIDREAARDPKSYQISDFTYKYHHLYGSPPIDLKERKIDRVVISEDGMKARLYLDQLRPGYAYEIKAPGVKNLEGKPLLHSFAYYTLNNIPDGAKWRKNEEETDQMDASDKIARSLKRQSKMPGDWQKPDQELRISTLPGMKYDKKELKVKAGAKIKLNLENPDDMVHNLVIVRPETADQVAKEALALGLKGEEMYHVPDSDQVLFHTALVQPNASESIFFEAPGQPGTYQFVCTLPGHARSMRGILIIE